MKCAKEMREMNVMLAEGLTYHMRPEGHTQERRRPWLGGSQDSVVVEIVNGDDSSATNGLLPRLSTFHAKVVRSKRTM